MANISIIHPTRSQVVDGAMTYSYEPINQADESDVKHFVATYNRALRMIADDSDNMSATIHLGERTQPRYAKGETVPFDNGGWLEHTIVIYKRGNPYMTIGAIQREPGASSEFHS